MYNKFSIIAPSTPTTKQCKKRKNNDLTSSTLSSNSSTNILKTASNVTIPINNKNTMPKKRGRPRTKNQHGESSFESEMVIISTEDIDPIPWRMVINKRDVASQTLTEKTSLQNDAFICKTCQLCKQQLHNSSSLLLDATTNTSPTVSSTVGVNTQHDVIVLDKVSTASSSQHVEKPKRSSISIEEILN